MRLEKQKFSAEPNLWNGLHFWCNCNQGRCIVTLCSHVMIVMYLVFCIQNDIKIQESKHNEKPLNAIDLGYIYKKWAGKNEKTCIPTCVSHGCDKQTTVSLDFFWVLHFRNNSLTQTFKNVLEIKNFFQAVIFVFCVV